MQLVSSPMPHQFGYNVQDYEGNNFGHSENSDGNNVQGEYRVQLPDGRTQIVTYNADHSAGFVADVRFEGEAQYPAPSPSYSPPAPSYSPPAPSYSPPAPSYNPPSPYGPTH
ncbi:pro-resilin-like [Oratosquilla oratoria]|uniref:pro-resilin-like n=1 Tax=Oratosquilla oratoria TaxID=337810 RepID=UPI003F7697E3